MKTPELFVSPRTLELSDEECELLRRDDIAGVVLFGINIGSEDELRSLTNSVHEIRDDLIVATDEEGGLVSRLYHLMPSSSQPYVNSLSDEQIASYYFERATRMKTLGFDLNLAPVVDLAPNRESVMYKRTYSSIGREVIRAARLCIEAQRAAGLFSCLKHFPGVGESSIDSHQAVPEIDQSFDEWSQGSGLIYSELVKANPEYIMLGHVRYPKIDEAPASSSQYWISALRTMGWAGKILIDDVTMKGFDSTIPASHLAEIGVDGVLVKDQNHPYVSDVHTGFEFNTGAEA